MCIGAEELKHALEIQRKCLLIKMEMPLSTKYSQYRRDLNGTAIKKRFAEKKLSFKLKEGKKGNLFHLGLHKVLGSGNLLLNEYAQEEDHPRDISLKLDMKSSKGKPPTIFMSVRAEVLRIGKKIVPSSFKGKAMLLLDSSLKTSENLDAVLGEDVEETQNTTLTESSSEDELLEGEEHPEFPKDDPLVDSTPGIQPSSIPSEHIGELDVSQGNKGVPLERPVPQQIPPATEPQLSKPEDPAELAAQRLIRVDFWKLMTSALTLLVVFDFLGISLLF